MSLGAGMREDACRVRCDHGAENLGVLRRIALNLVSLEHSVKGSKKVRIHGVAAPAMPGGRPAGRGTKPDAIRTKLDRLEILAPR